MTSSITSPLWRELGETMRRLREERGLSLRAAESLSGRSRRLLSQAERGAVRPSAELVRWYDDQFEAAGLLTAIYAEARADGGQQAGVPGLACGPGPDADDALRVLSIDPGHGSVAGPGERLTLRWRLRNEGRQIWRGRSLQRLGSIGGLRLLTSVRAVSVPDTAPGGEAEVTCSVLLPQYPGTVVGYWELRTADGRRCFPAERPLSAVLVVA
jgi:transcriptional regulator with XRE-family HTH domain